MDESDNLHRTNDGTDQNDDEQKLLIEEKLKVQKQIDELKKLIPEIESQLEIRHYGEYEIVGDSSLDSDSEPSHPTQGNIRDLLEYELFQLSGIYCSKLTEDECVFNISSSNSKSPYAVQILTQEESVRLGAWVMPWGITIDKIESETPLQSSKDVFPFIKNCVRCVHCHADREEQFTELKEITSSIKNVRVDATLGYITVLCHFLDVYDNSTDKKFNLTVNMFYGIGRARPSTINIEWNLKEKLTENMIIKMKTFAKAFKSQNLVDAFNDIRKKIHPIYIWKVEEYTDVLDMSDIHNLSESDSPTEMSENEDIAHTRKRKKSRRIRKRGSKPLSNEEMADKNPVQTAEDTLNSVEPDNDNLELSNDIPDSKSLPKRRGEPILLSAKDKQQPNVKQKAKDGNSKQTELSFKGVPISSVSISGNPNMKQRKDLNRTKKTTSTPMILRSVTHKLQTSIESLGISPIAKSGGKKSVGGRIQDQSMSKHREKKKEVNV